MNKNYFKYLVKQNKKILIVLFLFGFGICPIITGVINVKYQHHYSYEPSIGPFGFYLAMMVILAYLIPLINYRFIQYKRSVDTFLSLPIKRKTMFNTVTLFSLFEIFIPYLINIIFGILIIILKGYKINYTYLVLYLLISMSLVIVLYFINTFIVLKCNNSVDSIICMLAYTVLPFAIYLAKMNFIDRATFGVNGYYDFNFHYSLISMIIGSVTYLEKAFTGVVIDYEIIWYLFYLLFGLVMVYFCSKIFENRKGEDSEQITDSKLMYRLIIPFYTVICISFLSIENNMTDYIIFIIMIFIVYSIGTFIANRQVRITKWSIVMFVLAIIFTNVGTYVFKNTFGYSYSINYPTNYKAVVINIYSNYDNYSISGSASIEDKEFVKLIQTKQTELVDDYFNNKEYEDFYSHMHIRYLDGNGRTLNSYFYNVNNAGSKPILKKLVQDGYEVYKYNFAGGEEVKMTLEDFE